MKYLYCTIAIGEKYVESAIAFAKKLNQKSKTHHMLIVTDIVCEDIENVTFKIIPEDKVLFTRFIFNYNLKYYPLFLASSMDYEYVIFVDSDWRITDEYEEHKLIELLNYMGESGYDMFYERPHTIGGGKLDGDNCFWRHKRDFYKLMETTEFDEGNVCNEQFIIFANNEKFTIFVKKWEELYEIAANENLWAYAEGVEIGMSTVSAKMNCNYDNWMHMLRNMYEFNAISGQLYIRF